MKDIDIKKKAIGAFVNVFGGSVELLSPSDVFCRVYDKDKTPIAYIDVVIVRRNMVGSYPLKVTIAQLMKLAAKRLNPTIMWVFNDGLIYCKMKNISGEISFGKTDYKSPDELIVLITKRQKYIRFI